MAKLHKQEPDEEIAKNLRKAKRKANGEAEASRLQQGPPVDDEDEQKLNYLTPDGPQAETNISHNVTAVKEPRKQESESVAAASSAASAASLEEQQSVRSQANTAQPSPEFLECQAALAEEDRLTESFKETASRPQKVKQRPSSRLEPGKRKAMRDQEAYREDTFGSWDKLQTACGNGSLFDRRRLAMCGISDDLEAPHDLFAIFPIMMFLMLALFIFRQPLRQFVAEKSNLSRTPKKSC